MHFVIFTMCIAATVTRLYTILCVCNNNNNVVSYSHTLRDLWSNSPYVCSAYNIHVHTQYVDGLCFKSITSLQKKLLSSLTVCVCVCVRV